MPFERTVPSEYVFQKTEDMKNIAQLPVIVIHDRISRHINAFCCSRAWLSSRTYDIINMLVNYKKKNIVS